MVGIVDEALKQGGDENLKIGDHIKALTEFVQKTATPMTIGIQGDWGSGKTSLCNQIFHSLSEHSNNSDEGNYKQIWVNAWEHSLLCGPEESLIKIINQIIEELIDADLTKTKAESVKNGVKNVLHGAMRIGGAVALGAAGKDLADGMINNSVSSIAELRKDLKELVRDIRSAESNPYTKIIVYVDDLDRIVPENAVQILELLKNIFDIEDCVFILAIDYAVVIKGLEGKFGKKNEENEWEFRAFFDKIIQLPFRMPVNDYDLGDYILSLLDSIQFTSEDVELEDDLLEDLVKSSIGTNPRSIKRLINSLSLIKLLTDQRLGVDQAVDDILADKNQATVMFALVCLQVAFPDIYNLLDSYPDFWNWNEAIAAKVTHKKEEKAPYDNFTEDYKSSCQDKDQLDFDEVWEKALFRMCYINPKFRNRASSVSRFLSLLLESVITDKDIPDQSQRYSKLHELIKMGLSQTSVTSISSSEVARPKKGENKRFQEKGIEDWYERQHQQQQILLPDWSKESIQNIISVWKGQPFNAVDLSDEGSKDAKYVIEYATRISLKYDGKKIAEIEVDKKNQVKYSVLRTDDYNFALLTINDFDFNLKSGNLKIDRDTKSISGNYGSSAWMRAIINMANKGNYSDQMISKTLEMASKFKDKGLKDIPNAQFMNKKIKSFTVRQRNSKDWQDAADFLEFYYSDKNRKKIAVK
tara:strand:- start:67 stop:2160 length:2094 start_codon:yes stop_codon:yes gene_type:complete